MHKSQKVCWVKVARQKSEYCMTTYVCEILEKAKLIPWRESECQNSGCLGVEGTDWKREQKLSGMIKCTHTSHCHPMKMNQFLSVEPGHRSFYSPSSLPYSANSGPQ